MRDARGRALRLLTGVGFLFFVLFAVAVRQAASAYDGLVTGALPVGLALLCWGTAAWLRAADRARRAWMALGLCTWLLGLGMMALWVRPSVADAVPMTERMIREALHAELQPIEIPNCQLERFGEPHDGGYLVCANLLGSVKAVYSYGISGYDKWGCDMARRLNVRTHQYDCFDLTRPQCAGGVTVFHAECIGPSRSTDEAGHVFDTFENQFARNGDGANHVVVKIDVEGAEWQTFLETPPAVFERIDQLIVEFHGVKREHYVTAVRRLKQFFVVGNLHMNNYACWGGLEPWPTWAYEVLFVNKRLAVAGKPRAVPFHPLDAPNKAGVEDCQTVSGR